MYQETGNLTPAAPFDFTKSLAMLTGFMPLQSECSVSDQVLTMAINAHQQTVVCRLQSQGTIEAPDLAYTLYSEQPLHNTIQDAALDRVSFFLSLDDDLKPFYASAQTDEKFAPVVEEMYGYHQVKFISPFQSACWASLAQRNLRNTTIRMKNALLETYGSKLEIDGVTYYAFPEAAQLTDVSESELLLIIKNTRKAEYLHTLIQAFNGFDEQQLRTADYAEVTSWLHAIRGFGDWSVYFVMVRGLGRMEVFSTTEKATLEAASRLYGNGITLTRSEISQLADKYGTQKGYWAHYLRVGV